MSTTPAPAGGPKPVRKKTRIGHPGWWPLLLALPMGAAGGFAFSLLRMPLAWMLGAAIVCTVAAMAGARIGMDTRLRQGMQIVLGVLLGSSFTPDIVNHLPQWGASLGIMAMVTTIGGFLGWWLLVKVARYDRYTAFFAAMPGGLNEMVTMGGAYGADERRISLSHAVRILAVVMTVPLWYRLVEGLQVQSVIQVARGGHNEISDYAILVACGIVGAFVARAARLPAAFMFGPLLASAVVHLAGWTDSKPPGVLVALAQVVVGCGIGCRFVGAELRQVARDIAFGFALALILIVLAVIFAVLAHYMVGLRSDALVLCYAPGGFAEMSLIGLALGIEVSMVATHHLFRVFMIVLGAPLVFRGTLARKPLPAARRQGD